MICNKCGKRIIGASWDIDGGICQECWEDHCAEMWLRTGWGMHEPIKDIEISESPDILETKK